MNRYALSLTLLSFLLSPSAFGAGLHGVYSHVVYSEETGDLLGMEVEVRGGPKPSIVVSVCEGACWGGKTWPLTVEGNRLSFTVEEELADRYGKPTPPLILHYIAVRKGAVLVVTSPDGDIPGWKETLKRVPHPKPGQTARLGCGDTSC
ncbi:hypothetical protein [Nitrospirillum viridazoti]|uniref:Uncharacterized protein n=1 Tax=Nitrospirillum amazonense TaxID=28077 RepID=A0A560HQ13_9PROT|nr:hypothetical protein [Nitrospirillum amazonense]TWB47160.1 hypothetical protein FBZ92_13726 [Nitrospirillum amazonense]